MVIYILYVLKNLIGYKSVEILKKIPISVYISIKTGVLQGIKKFNRLIT